VKYRPSAEPGLVTATTTVTRHAAIWARIAVSVTALIPTKLFDLG
jgi:hypothetical protein